MTTELIKSKKELVTRVKNLECAIRWAIKHGYVPVMTSKVRSFRIKWADYITLRKSIGIGDHDDN